MRLRVKVNIPEFEKNKEKLVKATEELLTEIGHEIRTEARENAPKGTGHLAESIEILSKTKRSLKVGSKLIYGPIHEFGGTIRPKKHKVMRVLLDGRWVTVRKIHIKASKYLTRAKKKVEYEVPQIGERVMRRNGL